ncbi:MAG: hypothetical protein ACTHM2_00625 [Afipia sp.]
MMKMRMLAAAAAVAAAMTTPALAMDQVQPRSGAHARYYDSNAYYAGSGWDRGDHWDRRDSGFWPGDVAANVVGGALGTAGVIAGGAVGTAGAIASAPFRGGAYAYNGAYPGAYSGNATSFNGPSGFVCQPGTWFRGEDGRNHICQ